MPDVTLATPNSLLRDSYRSLVGEFVDRGEKLVPFVLAFDHRDFDLMLARLTNCSRGIVLIGYLIFKSTFMPRVLGLLEAVAGLCWLTFLWPPLAHALSPYQQALAAVGEVSLMLWLIVIGVNAGRWKGQAGVRITS